MLCAAYADVFGIFMMKVAVAAMVVFSYSLYRSYVYKGVG